MDSVAAQKRMPELPGLYFDPEKNKYFKIEAGTAHSSDIVKRRRLNDYKAEEAQTKEAILKPYIRRSRTLQNPLLAGFLDREHGGRYTPEEALGAGFGGQEVIFQDALTSEIPMPAFAWDPVTRGLCVPRSAQQMLAVCPENVPGSPTERKSSSDFRPVGGSRQDLLYRPENCMNLVFERHKISSINVNEAARLLITTWMDNGYFGIVVAYLGNKLAIPNTPGRLVSDGSHIHIRPPLHHQFPNLTVWTSVPAPPSSTLSFVVGMDDHLLTIEKERSQTKWYSHSSDKKREMLSLDFLHNQPTVVLAGDRSGEISLLDFRAPNPELGEDTIRNPSPVTHIKSLDDHRLLVAGPGAEGTRMFQYDLRWRGKAAFKVPMRPRDICSIPIVEYPDHHNTNLKFGLDVDVDAGLIAAAQDEGGVRLFSLHGGHMIPEFETARDRLVKVECVRFMADREGGPKSLYVGGSHTIDRYAW